MTMHGHSKSFSSTSPSKYSRSPSKHQFQTEDGVENAYDMNDPPVHPMPIPCKKMQNDYIHGWIPQMDDFLHILLGLEAPPVPWMCKICQKDGDPAVDWGLLEDCALHMTGLQLHLGHGGVPCPSASMNEPAPLSGQSWHATVGKDGDQVKDDIQDTQAMDDGEWEDVDNIPLHLWLPLFLAKLCPSTFDKPSTTFTFSVLDDFLRDNVECGTSGMNYYSKLHWVTSNVFPHLVVVAWQWCLLKLLKWSSFQDNKNCTKKGDLVIFCAACPQPGINIGPTANLDDWKYSRTVVMDGNFKAEHMHERWPDDQVWLMDGHGFMVANPPYQAYLKATPHITEDQNLNHAKEIFLQQSQSNQSGKCKPW
ncbi:hypothetical protein BKA83DRAFT_4132739 [Pisolithus microcarpus]|nr:hypothetical protein BKA83DRAFT_4132739 [Pisolithus microcarpus]